MIILDIGDYARWLDKYKWGGNEIFTLCDFKSLQCLTLIKMCKHYCVVTYHGLAAEKKLSIIAHFSQFIVMFERIFW